MTDAKTAFAGAILEVFSATLKALMAVSNAEIALSGPLGCWNLVSMVETRGGCERIAESEGHEKGPESLYRRASVLS